MTTQNNIKALRKKAGLSQQAVADLCNTDKTQILRLENGSRRLTHDWMVRIAKALRVQPEDLIATSHPKTIIEPVLDSVIWEIFPAVAVVARQFPDVPAAKFEQMARKAYRDALAGKIPSLKSKKESTKAIVGNIGHLAEYESARR